jgi:DNA-binding NarL/FixJ family response regulator
MTDWTNCLLALEHCAGHGDVEEGLRLCNAIRIAWLAAGDQGGSVWLDMFLDRASAVRPGIRARALVVRSEIAFEQEDVVAAERYAQAALLLSQACDDGNVAGARRMLALTALLTGRPSDAFAEADAAISAARQAADSWEEGITFSIKAAAIARQGDLVGAYAANQQALAALGDSRGWAVANVHYELGRLARARGDHSEAHHHFSQALALYRQVDARPPMVRCLAGIGQLALDAHDLAVARANLTEAMTLSLAIGHRQAIARSLAAFAALAVASGDLAAAVRLAGTARTLFDALNAPKQAAVGRLGALVEAAQAELGQEVVLSLLAEGRGMTAYEAARRALAPVVDHPRRGEPASWPGPLTDREREVAMLVAEGLANRAIGDKLFIAQATVARHIANIFGKLDFTSRAQLIDWVVKSAHDRSCGPAGYIP